MNTNHPQPTHKSKEKEEEEDKEKKIINDTQYLVEIYSIHTHTFSFICRSHEKNDRNF